ncbi:MAG: acylneuraminate cytidylyltransferase family protein [Acidimicrobiales bacterium]
MNTAKHSIDCGPTVAFVFARGGSKGLLDKNLRVLGGTTLVGRAVDAALAAETVDRVVVSTDSPAIAAVARDHGAEVPWLRPRELATDTCPERLAWRHACDEVEATSGPIGLFVSVPATAPLRHFSDIDRAVERYRAGSADLVVTVAPARASPYFTVVGMDAECGLGYLVDGGGRFARRQDAPEVFEITPVAYVSTPQHIRSADRLFQGRVEGSVVPAERAVDIDDDLDLAFAEFLVDRAAAETRTAKVLSTASSIDR